MLVSAVWQLKSAIIKIYHFPAPHPLRPPPRPSRLSQSAKLDSLRHIATSYQLSILHRAVNICRCYFFHSSYSLLLPLCPQVHSLYLSLQSFPANWFINTIFLDSKYMHYYTYLPFWLTSLCITSPRSIHLTRTDSNPFFLWLSNIPLYIYVYSRLNDKIIRQGGAGKGL